MLGRFLIESIVVVPLVVWVFVLLYVFITGTRKELWGAECDCTGWYSAVLTVSLIPVLNVLIGIAMVFAYVVFFLYTLSVKAVCIVDRLGR